MWLTAYWYNPRRETGPACEPVSTNIRTGVVMHDQRDAMRITPAAGPDSSVWTGAAATASSPVSVTVDNIVLATAIVNFPLYARIAHLDRSIPFAIAAVALAAAAFGLALDFGFV